MTHRPLSRETVAFRTAIIDGCNVDPERFFYVSMDVLVAVCPVCDGALTIAFHGAAARADLRCHRGCAESDIARVMGLGVSPWP
jgi:hypothetical protein